MSKLAPLVLMLNIACLATGTSCQATMPSPSSSGPCTDRLDQATCGVLAKNGSCIPSGMYQGRPVGAYWCPHSCKFCIEGNVRKVVIPFFSQRQALVKVSLIGLPACSFRKAISHPHCEAFITGGCSCGPSWPVKTGDTLYNISLTCGYTIEQLMRANYMVRNNYIWVGQRLRMPGACSPAGFGTPGGRCGVTGFGVNKKGYTCPPSQCCSQYGWCGVTLEHCDRANKCQDRYGICLNDGQNYQPIVSKCSPKVKETASWQQIGTTSSGFGIMTERQCCKACKEAVTQGGACLRGQPNGNNLYWLHISNSSMEMVCDPWWDWWWSWGRK